ncbi:nitroreductase/quinone reductase family protein [Gordonia aichiensis]|uniref:nitroreductase/quinone reductase family protein n=1 Tax=Gordonia aichiensis TaxID=36820 RepID=UPI0032649133
MSRDDHDHSAGGRLLPVSNAAVGALIRLGAAPRACRELLVRGRRSERLTARPVNVLVVDGRRYLVSPRGSTQWVRNVRAGGEVFLRRGRRVDPVDLIELDDEQKPDLLRAYLDRWGWQVSAFVDGLTASSTDAEFAAAAPRFPVFECAPRHRP